MNLFREESNDPKTNAQRNLAMRTHYADDDTLRFFYARILSTRVIAGGLLFGLVESVALDPNNSRRGYRAVIFDVFGTVVLRADMESARKTADAARKDLANHGLDAIALTRAGIERQRENNARELERLAADVDKIAAQREAA